MITNSGFNYLKNAPIPVDFCGLRGTTSSMQSSGWELAIERGLHGCYGDIEFRLAGKHSGMNLRILSWPTRVCRQALDTAVRSGNFNPASIMMFNVRISAEAINFVVPESRRPTFHAVSFNDISMDSMQMDHMYKAVHENMDDLIFFQPNNENVDIYVPEAKIWTIQEHLDEALRMEMPKQAELREKARKRRNDISGDHSMNSKTSGDVKLRLLLA